MNFGLSSYAGQMVKLFDLYILFLVFLGLPKTIANFSCLQQSFKKGESQPFPRAYDGATSLLSFYQSSSLGLTLNVCTFHLTQERQPISGWWIFMDVKPVNLRGTCDSQT